MAAILPASKCSKAGRLKCTNVSQTQSKTGPTNNKRMTKSRSYVKLVWFGLFGLFCIISIPYPIPSMMDGWPAGYDVWMATIHDGWKKQGSAPGPGHGPLNDGPRAPFLFVVSTHSIMDAGHPSIIAGRPFIHHGWYWIGYWNMYIYIYGVTLNGVGVNRCSFSPTPLTPTPLRESGYI